MGKMSKINSLTTKELNELVLEKSERGKAAYQELFRRQQQGLRLADEAMEGHSASIPAAPKGTKFKMHRSFLACYRTMGRKRQ
jgi:predicted transposase YdaD